jgi:hypothetical protein
MIKVKVEKSSNAIVSILASGHAGSGEYGHDLVCASVSAILTGGANAINEKKSFEIKLASGEAIIRLKENEMLSTHDEVVLETILVELQTIEESYRKFINIEIL